MIAPKMPSRTQDNTTSPLVLSQLIPEGAGTVKTHGWLFFALFASFLILAGASK
jgi:hypothetical protein